jgi:hypothetical protein
MKSTSLGKKVLQSSEVHFRFRKPTEASFDNGS